MHNSRLEWKRAGSGPGDDRASTSPKRKDGFWEDEHNLHIYEAMKNSRLEISEAIRRRKLILFETVPMNFEEAEEYKGSAHFADADADPADFNLSKW